MHTLTYQEDEYSEYKIAICHDYNFLDFLQ